MAEAAANARGARLDAVAAALAAAAAEIIGQDHVLRPVSERLLQAELGLTDPSRPLGSFLLLGPTGVGKTQLAKAVARQLSPQGRLARWDMSEFQTKDSVDVMLGRGVGDEGRFGAELRRVPDARVLLFDEVEKGHRDLLDLFLQMLDDARLTVASGRTFDLSQTYIFLTSNLGGAAAMRMLHNSAEAIELTVIAHARQQLRPEFFARVDQVAVFRRLGLVQQEEICRQLVACKLAELRECGVSLQAQPDVYRCLLQEGFSEQEGARRLRRTVERLINAAVVNRWAEGAAANGQLAVAPSNNFLCIH